MKLSLPLGPCLPSGSVSSIYTAAPALAFLLRPRALCPPRSPRTRLQEVGDLFRECRCSQPIPIMSIVKVSCKVKRMFVFKSISLTFQGCPGGSDAEASACRVGDPGLIPGLGRSPGEGNGSPLQYSCLDNPIDGGTWWATVHGVAESQTRLSDFTLSTFQPLVCSCSDGGSTPFVGSLGGEHIALVMTPQALGGSLFRTQDRASAPWTDCFTGGTLEKPQEQALDGSLLVARQSCTEPGRTLAGSQVGGAEPVGELLGHQDSASAQPPTTLPTLSPRASPHGSQLSRSPELWSSRPATESPPPHPTAAICCKNHRRGRGFCVPPPPGQPSQRSHPQPQQLGLCVDPSRRPYQVCWLWGSTHPACPLRMEPQHRSSDCHLYFQSWWSFPPF